MKDAQCTKVQKIYDQPYRTTIHLNKQKQIEFFLQKKPKKLQKPINYSKNRQKPLNRKNLLFALSIENLLLSQNKTKDSQKKKIKENYFIKKGITNSLSQLCQKKKNLQRTCSLVSVIRFPQRQVGLYEFNPDILFRRSPQCSILPKSKNIQNHKRKFKLLQKQNSPLKFGQEPNFKLDEKVKIKDLVGKEIQEQINKRRAICKTAPTKHLLKKNAQLKLSLQYDLFDEDISKMEAKLYSEMRQNKQKIKKRNKERIGINIQKNKSFNSIQVNKNTLKILKKYHCEGFQYFNKFMLNE